MTYIFDAFNRDGERFLARYRNSQKYISGEAKDMVFWPPAWCLSFNTPCCRDGLQFLLIPKLPQGTKVVAFTGNPIRMRPATGIGR